jgi:hypothetical protein
MALVSTNAPSILGGFGASVASFFTAIIETSAMAREAEARGAQFAQLNAKTDEELAAMNLTREGIASYVFRDLLFI